MQSKGFVDEFKMIFAPTGVFEEEHELEILLIQLAFLKCSSRVFTSQILIKTKFNIYFAPLKRNIS